MASALVFVVTAIGNAQDAAPLLRDPPDPPASSLPDVLAFARSPYAHTGYGASADAVLRLDQAEGPRQTTLFSLRVMPDGFESHGDEAVDVWPRPFNASHHRTLYSSELSTVDLSPGIAAGFGPHFHVGAGVDLPWSDSLREFYPWFLTAGPSKAVKGEAEAFGVGGNVGLTLHVTERQRIGLTYRTPLDINYRGDLHLYNGSPVLGGGVFRTEMKTHIKFPTIVAAGYGINLTEALRLEADVEWLQFSKLKDLPLMVANGLPGLPGSVNENWRDTFTIGFGGHYRLGEHWIVRAGYQFYHSPVPDSTFSPAVADVDQNFVSVGVGFRYGNHALEATYGADFYDSSRITDFPMTASNGTENVTMHLFSFAYRFAF